MNSNYYKFINSQAVLVQMCKDLDLAKKNDIMTKRQLALLIGGMFLLQCNNLHRTTFIHLANSLIKDMTKEIYDKYKHLVYNPKPLNSRQSDLTATYKKHQLIKDKKLENNSF